LENSRVPLYALEIYNETVADLLAEPGSGGVAPNIREHDKKGVFVEGLTEVGLCVFSIALERRLLSTLDPVTPEWCQIGYMDNPGCHQYWDFACKRTQRQNNNVEIITCELNVKIIKWCQPYS
jgi:hypothetical protein